MAYWNGSKVKTTPLSKWSASLGIPVGVVVVPKGFAPDRKVRIIGLNNAEIDLLISMLWGPYGTETSLINYTKVPITDNTGSTSTDSHTGGYLPSDKFTGAQSFVDSKAKYSKTSYLIPSPYLGDEPNPEYYKTISGNNMLSDFNGLSNTETLVKLGSGYMAANAAWNYNDDSGKLQWYLPGMGELGYIMPRFNEINNTITALGGLPLENSLYLWSSSEYSSSHANAMDISGNVGRVNKDYSCDVRPFAIID